VTATCEPQVMTQANALSLSSACLGSSRTQWVRHAARPRLECSTFNACVSPMYAAACCVACQNPAHICVSLRGVSIKPVMLHACAGLQVQPWIERAFNQFLQPSAVALQINCPGAASVWRASMTRVFYMQAQHGH